jgi:hypothetical protein
VFYFTEGWADADGGNESCLLFSNVLLLREQTECLPPSYGSSRCAQWDEGLSWCSDESYCSLPWCYVDRDTCRSADVDIQRSLAFPGLALLFFSYQTCAMPGTAVTSTHDFTRGTTFEYTLAMLRAHEIRVRHVWPSPHWTSRPTTSSTR